MLSDHFTKPLQVELFRKFRAEIMNIPIGMSLYDMGWDGVGTEKGVTWKLHEETDPECPHECVGKYRGTKGERKDVRIGNDRKTGSVLLDRAGIGRIKNDSEETVRKSYSDVVTGKRSVQDTRK